MVTWYLSNQKEKSPVLHIDAQKIFKALSNLFCMQMDEPQSTQVGKGLNTYLTIWWHPTPMTLRTT